MGGLCLVPLVLCHCTTVFWRAVLFEGRVQACSRWFGLSARFITNSRFRSLSMIICPA